MKPKYDLNRMKFATDQPTLERAVKLDGFSAVARGGSPYRVFVSARHYDRGGCTCYLGQEDVLCKHMAAAAIRAVTGGKRLNDEDKQFISQPTCSGRLGVLSREALTSVKKSITGTLRYIKPYDGPSRTWFAYQDSLQEGCNRLAKIVSELPVSEQTAQLLVDMLLRLDDKLSSGGVDDSDGTVGGFIEETVRVLKEYARLDPSCIKTFNKLKGKETCFGWEETLVAFINAKK